MSNHSLQQYLDTLSLSTEQKEEMWRVLQTIRKDEQLLDAFLSLETEDTYVVDSENKSPDPEHTFFGFDFDLTEYPEEAELETIVQETEEYISETLDIFLGFDDSETLALEESIIEDRQEPLSTPPKPSKERYEDLGLLGKGGMGEVRKVRDTVLNRNLAMKIIHTNFLSNKTALSRFVEEAQVGAQLQHPNIVPIHDLGELPDGRLYFTMKEIRGREFTDLIQEVHDASTEIAWKPSSQGTTFRRLIQIFHTMCETMAFSHSLGVIHRDLKPENVMIGDFGEVLVVDWGIAKVLGTTETLTEDIVQTDHARATRMGMVAGTPSYMSPEQAMGRVDLVSTHSDIYTLGAILYEILSGNPPYTGASALEIVEKVKEKRPVSLLLTAFENAPIADIPNVESLNEATGKIPLPLIEICEKAMKRDISDRYQSAAELAKEISDWLEGAQKRDKAIQEYELGLEKQKQAQIQEEQYEILWKEAEALFLEEGHASEQGWSIWRKGMKYRQEALLGQQEYRKSLQAALVYDFEFEDANEALALMLIDDIVRAIAHGQSGEQRSLEKQFQAYVQQLSSKRKQELHRTLEQKRTNHIMLQRARRGALIGRQSLKAEVQSALRRQERIVSLIGTAGVGKTRLALEVAHTLSDSVDDVYFCDISQASSTLDVIRFVAQAMDIRLRNVDPVGQLGEIFADQSTILVLDKVEQAIDPVRAILTQWLQQASSLRILTTSRMRLRLADEYTISIAPLNILEAMELFTKRGQKANGAFSLNTTTRTIVGRIVTQLDYLPLAIELAAARLSLFSVGAIEKRLQERFSFLRSRDSQVQALQGALDWSWELLKPWSKAVLSQISLFRGGFDIEAAEDILQLGTWKNTPAIVDILQDLCDDSLLLQTKSETGTIRYGLLGSIRQYASERLKDNDAVEQALSGEEAYRRTGHRHARYYSRFGTKEALSAFDNQEDQSVWNRFRQELDNFIAGTEYSTGTSAFHCCKAALKILERSGPVSLGIELSTIVSTNGDVSLLERQALHIIQARFLRISGKMKEARQARKVDRKEFLAAYPSLHTEEFSTEEIERLQLKAEGLWEDGNIEEAESNYTEALEHYRNSMEIYAALDDKKGLIRTHQKRGLVFNNQGNFDQAYQELEQALTLAEEEQQLLLIAELSSSLGRICRQKSNYQGALKLFQKALETCKKMGDRFGESDNLGKMGILYSDLGQYEHSIEHYKRSLLIAQEIGNKRQEGTTLGNLGVVYRNIGEYEQAIDAFNQAKKIAQDIGNRIIESGHLGNIGCIYTDMGEFEQAVAHHERAIEIARDIGDKMNEGINLGNLGGNLIQLERWREAQQILKQAIAICEATLPPAAGAFSGALAWTLIQLNQKQEALDTLEKGEPLVAVYPLEHGKFLCQKAKVFQRSNRQSESISALEQAKEIARNIQADPESILPKTIRETEAYLGHIDNPI